MITAQFLIRVDLKYETSSEKAVRRLVRCHTALFGIDTLSVESMSGNGCCAPYIAVVVSTKSLANEVERVILKIVGRWVECE
jgi:hypothetical protein